MELTRNTVQQIAGLARLTLSASEVEQLRNELQQILGYVDKLNALAIDDVPPTSYAVPVSCQQRPDRAEASGIEEAILTASPDHENGHFVVPRVIEP